MLTKVFTHSDLPRTICILANNLSKIGVTPLFSCIEFMARFEMQSI